MEITFNFGLQLTETIYRGPVVKEKRKGFSNKS